MASNIHINLTKDYFIEIYNYSSTDNIMNNTTITITNIPNDKV